MNWINSTAAKINAMKDRVWESFKIIFNLAQV
jgi:hypothetical protein